VQAIEGEQTTQSLSLFKQLLTFCKLYLEAGLPPLLALFKADSRELPTRSWSSTDPKQDRFTLQIFVLPTLLAMQPLKALTFSLVVVALSIQLNLALTVPRGKDSLEQRTLDDMVKRGPFTFVLKKVVKTPADKLLKKKLLKKPWPKKPEVPRKPNPPENPALIWKLSSMPATPLTKVLKKFRKAKELERRGGMTLALGKIVQTPGSKILNTFPEQRKKKRETTPCGSSKML
jgi:hypothetical protein